MTAMEWWAQAFSRENDVGEGEMPGTNGCLVKYPMFHVKMWFILQLKTLPLKKSCGFRFQVCSLCWEGLELNHHNHHLKPWKTWIPSYSIILAKWNNISPYLESRFPWKKEDVPSNLLPFGGFRSCKVSILTRYILCVFYFLSSRPSFFGGVKQTHVFFSMMKVSWWHVFNDEKSQALPKSGCKQLRATAYDAHGHLATSWHHHAMRSWIYSWNLKHGFINGWFSWMIPNLYMKRWLFNTYTSIFSACLVKQSILYGMIWSHPTETTVFLMAVEGCRF